MSKDIVFLINKSEITAGTRGASLGPGAVMTAARKNHKSFFGDFPVEEINCGLWKAVEEFLKNNADWVLHERYTNNNGLTILKKQTPSIVVGSLQLLRLAPTEFNHSPSTSSTARSSM